MSSESFEEKFERLEKQIAAAGAGVISGGDWLNIAVHAIPWLIEYVKQLRVKLAKYAAKDLLATMRDISEDCWAAGWISGLEYTLWSFVQNGNPVEFGLGTVSSEDLTKLRELSEACGGWWHLKTGQSSLMMV